MYPEVILSPEEKTGVPRGSHRLHRRRRAGEEIRLADRRSHRPPAGHPGLRHRRTIAFTIRGIYRAGSSAVDNQSMMFHWKYADERQLAAGTGRLGRHAGRQPRSGDAGALRRSTSGSPTRRTRPRPIPSRRSRRSFASMLGNLNLLLGSVALAVVLTTLFVAGNTMAMSVRERTTEIAVMRTLGFPARDDLPARRRRGAGRRAARRRVIGAALARADHQCRVRSAWPGGFIPAFGVNNWNVVVGLGLSVLIGLLAGGDPGDDGVAAEDRGCAAAGRVTGLERRSSDAAPL